MWHKSMLDTSEIKSLPEQNIFSKWCSQKILFHIIKTNYILIQFVSKIFIEKKTGKFKFIKHYIKFNQQEQKINLWNA